MFLTTEALKSRFESHLSGANRVDVATATLSSTWHSSSARTWRRWQGKSATSRGATSADSRWSRHFRTDQPRRRRAGLISRIGWVWAKRSTRLALIRGTIARSGDSGGEASR